MVSIRNFLYGRKTDLICSVQNISLYSLSSNIEYQPDEHRIHFGFSSILYEYPRKFSFNQTDLYFSY